MREYTTVVNLLFAFFDALIPRHWRAERARSLERAEIARLVAPRTLPKIPWVHTLLPYRDPGVRALIHAVKYYGERSLAARVAPFAAEYLMEVLAENVALGGWREATLTPVASSPRRLRERGYNQAALFAEAIAQELEGVSYDATLLTRENRPSQVHVSRSRRHENIAQAFRATSRAAGRYIILIDDVAESGATLLDARRALLEAGAQDVIALAIAH